MSRITIGPKNDERTREYESNGIKYILKANDPYGFVKITCMKLNKTLDGQYTSFDEAAKAATRHALTFNKPKENKEV